MAKGKYQEWLTEDGLMRLESWARDGLTDEQIAKNMGVSTATFYNWQKKYLEILEAIKKGKRPIDFEVENAALKSALGEWVTETDTIFNYQGDTVVSKQVIAKKRYIAPNPTVIIYWLNNRKPSQWRKLSDADAKKLEVEAKKLEIEAKKLEEELKQMQENKGTEIIIVDEWSNKDE